jgi:hypothetical protein
LASAACIIAFTEPLVTNDGDSAYGQEHANFNL